MGSKHYIDKDDFYNEILKSKENDQLTDKAVAYCFEIVERVAQCNHYNSQEDYEDCKMHAMLNIARYWRNFNPEKSKDAFAYFTSFAWTGLSQGWNVLYPSKRRDVVPLSAVTRHDYASDWSPDDIGE